MVSLVYLGRNDDDKEMHKMCEAIAKKFERAYSVSQRSQMMDDILYDPDRPYHN
jgi:hypothetical protein